MVGVACCVVFAENNRHVQHSASQNVATDSNVAS